MAAHGRATPRLRPLSALAMALLSSCSVTTVEWRSPPLVPPHGTTTTATAPTAPTPTAAPELFAAARRFIEGLTLRSADPAADLEATTTAALGAFLLGDDAPATRSADPPPEPTLQAITVN